MPNRLHIFNKKLQRCSCCIKVFAYIILIIATLGLFKSF